MTTTTKDITEYLDDKGVNYNEIRFIALLAQLDWEQLEDLLNAFQDVYTSGENEGMSDNNSSYQNGYDAGYADGQEDA